MQEERAIAAEARATRAEAAAAAGADAEQRAVTAEAEAARWQAALTNVAEVAASSGPVTLEDVLRAFAELQDRVMAGTVLAGELQAELSMKQSKPPVHACHGFFRSHLRYIQSSAHAVKHLHDAQASIVTPDWTGGLPVPVPAKGECAMAG